MSIAATWRRSRATIVAGIIVLAAITALCVLAWEPATGAGHGLVARVHLADGTSQDLPLDDDGTFEFSSELGRNVVVVENGAARVTEADCAHGDCTRQAPISSPGQQLICLPHQLWVEVVEAGADDGEMDVTAVTSADGDGNVDVVSR